ncbi:choice-of-anchor L domain-containing protein [Myroides sp. JBRI-B21084]|uniref:choice-of-anchor L domain-containing protein n=1 Tax=Myroides sp. JBRI-B21084 TaxID=3119977 RepID=UPI0026E14B00|nr:choice-of-anchor L domain-containing protein [Paenimyroides cloacae]WKW47581.1 choice-of-anchor L domain-containing protein [Paenimyroides cloacae]
MKLNKVFFINKFSQKSTENTGVNFLLKFVTITILLFSTSNFAQNFPIRNSITTNPPIVPTAIGSFIEVNNSASPQSAYTISQLINNVLISGGGNCTSANATNVVVSPNLQATNTNRSWGYFHKAASNFPFQSGIVLSTGFARKAGNNFINPTLSDNLPTGGDADLASVLNVSSSLLYNATYIEFDFVPITNQITFNYLLASEEYGDGFECSFTDAFALLLKKVGDPTYTNLAVLPNNGGVVSTSNIHPAINGAQGSCGAVNQQYFGGYNTSNSDTNFQGRTVPLTATATVIPGETYHFKMVIADFQDEKYDTAVFLDAGSFDIGVKITDTSGAVLGSNMKVCDVGQTIKASVLATNATYKWLLNGTQIPGATSSSYTVTQPGVYTVEVTVPSSTCVSTASITVTSGSVPPVDITDLNGNVLPASILSCNTVNTALKATTTAVNPTYQWYLNNTIIAGATLDTYVATQTGTYSVKVSSANYDCSVTKSIDFTFTDLIINTPVDIQACSPTSSTTFNLTQTQGQITANTNATFTYYELLSDAQAANTNVIANPTAFVSIPKTVYALVQWSGCSKIASINLQTVLSPTITSQPTNKIVCVGNSVIITATAINDAGLQWQVNAGSGFTDLVNNSTYSGVTTNALTINNVALAMNGYTYKLIVKSTCSQSLESTVATITIPQVKGTLTKTNVFCFGDSNGTATVVGYGGTAPYTYLWSTNATTATATGLQAGTYTVKITDANGCFGTESVVITQPAALTNTSVLKNVSCKNGNDGSIEIKPAGGTLPYSYTWSHTTLDAAKVEGLVAGTYNVIIKDANNCIKTEQITITEPTSLNATLTVKNVTCFNTANGEITANVSGGTAPYTFNWSNGKTSQNNTDLIPGDYTVIIIDAKGCSITKTATITQPQVLQLTYTQTKAGCNGALANSVIVTPTGGVLPYTYLWSNGATTNIVDDLLPGNYTVKVTDANNCVLTENVTVIPSTNVSISFNKKDVSCNGLINGFINTTVTGGKAPYSYSWSNGVSSASITNLAAGTFTLTVTDGFGCVYTESVTINQPQDLTASFQQTNVTCYGTTTGSITVNVTGGTPPYSYQWSNGSNSQVIDQLPAGLYTVLITDSKNCTLTTSTYISQPNDIALPVTTNQVFCVNQNATIANLAASGSNIQWYTTPIGGSPLNSTQLLSSGSYYASQTVNGCESYGRAGINVSINSTAIPSGLNIQEFCEPTIPYIYNLQLTGQDIKWYDSATNGTLLSANTLLVNGKTYYASQTINGCESVNRFAVLVNIYPSVAIKTSSLVVCNTAAIQNITIDNFTSAQLKWYSSLTSTQPLPSSYLLQTGTYYVSTLNHNLCESVRKPIQIITTAGVTIPTVITQQVFCNAALVSDLTAVGMPGATIKWYNSAQSVTPLTANTPLLTGTYYVEQEIAPCASPRVAVAVRVYSSTPPTMTDFVLCDGATVADLFLQASTTTKYVWYLDNTSTTPLPNTYSLTTGYYYVAIDYTGCVSDRRKVHVKVNTRPSSPTGATSQVFNKASTVANLVMNQPNVTWYLSYNDAVNRMNPLDITDVLVDGTIYYGVVIDANGCPSYPTAVKVTLLLSTNTFDTTNLKYYPNPVVNELVINYSENIKQVEVYNMAGKQVFKNTYDDSTIKIDFSHFSSGTYIVKLATENQSQTIKIIKK